MFLKHTSFTHLTVEECTEKLEAVMDQASFFRRRPYSKLLVGKVRDGRFRLFKRSVSRNPYALWLVGRYRPFTWDAQVGTLITSHYMMSPLILAVTLFGVLPGYVFVRIAIEGLLLGEGLGFFAGVLSIPAAFAGIIGLLLHLGWQRGRWILEFVRETLEAAPFDPDTGEYALPVS
jgi:hypothetical protein